MSNSHKYRKMIFERLGMRYIQWSTLYTKLGSIIPDGIEESGFVLISDDEQDFAYSAEYQLTC